MRYRNGRCRVFGIAHCYKCICDCSLECEVELDSHATLVSTGSVAVCQSPHIVHTEECEDVVKTCANFHIRLFAKSSTIRAKWELV